MTLRRILLHVLLWACLAVTAQTTPSDSLIRLNRNW